jgi:hypothetical protein
MLHSAQSVIDAFTDSPLIMSSATAVILLLAYIRHIFREHNRPRLNRVTGRPKGEAPLPQGSSGREWKGWAAETSKENSYYFAHGKTGNDGLKQEDYQMNGPKLLAKQTSLGAMESPASPTATSTTVELAGTRVTNYSFADSDREVEVLLALDGWDWTKVAADELSVNHTDNSLTGACSQHSHVY